MKKSNSLQDHIINQARRNSQTVTIFLVSGMKINGKIIGFDGFTILIEFNKRQQMIYKHAISTIVLDSPVTLPTH